MDPLSLPIHRQLDALANGSVTAQELVSGYLVSADAQAHLKGYLSLDRVGAHEAAVQADARRAAGETGPLLGIPLAIKDNLSTSNLPTTCASALLDGHRPTWDAEVVTRLKAAGAIVLGKTNLDEFGMGSSTENSAFGPSLNPWDPSRVPGGSSGGSAVVVAGTMASAALGSDTGGSIRQPAALCGLVGLKPTWGRISRRGLVAFASSLDVVGPLTRDVRDAAQLFEVLAGHDPQDSTSSHRATEDVLTHLEDGVRGLRVGYLPGLLEAGVSPAICAAMEGAMGLFQSLGARTVEAALPHAEYGVSTYYLVAAAEASSNLSRYDGIRFGQRAGDGDLLERVYSQTRSVGFGAEVKRRIMLGTWALSAGYYDAWYQRAQDVRDALKADFDAVFSGCDVLIGPTTPTTAFKLGEKSTDPLEMYLSDIFTLPASLAQLPALSLPLGLDETGLPMGLQVVGPRFSEGLILRVARALERALGVAPLKPSHASEVRS